MIIAGIVMSHLGLKSNSGINIAILAGSTVWVCSAFAKKNRRYFSAKEKTSVVLGLIVINLCLQALFGSAALSQSPSGLNTNALIFAIGFVGILHSIAIYFFVGLAKKPLVKQGVIDN
jgi:hypothetical protein